jgi:hypothetical protein
VPGAAWQFGGGNPGERGRARSGPCWGRAAGPETARGLGRRGNGAGPGDAGKGSRARWQPKRDWSWAVVGGDRVCGEIAAISNQVHMLCIKK